MAWSGAKCIGWGTMVASVLRLPPGAPESPLSMIVIVPAMKWGDSARPLMLSQVTGAWCPGGMPFSLADGSSSLCPAAGERSNSLLQGGARL